MSGAEIGRAIAKWQADGGTCGFARVTGIRGIGSAATGEMLAWNEAGDTEGELLGGALDAPIREAARRLLAGRRSLEVLDLTIDDTGAHEAGLSCAGGATIVVQDTAGIPAQFWAALAEHRSVALATVAGDPAGSLVAVDGGGSFGSLGGSEVDAAAEEALRRLLANGETMSSQVEAGDRTVLTCAFVPEPSLVVVGDGAIAGAIARQAGVLGWQATITDDADTASAALTAAGASAALVLLTHAVKLDVPVLAEAIRAGVPYIGALGSSRTQVRRAERLRNLGFTDAEIETIHGPIGLDLGGNRPTYIALAVCAEILAARNRRAPASLRGRTAPIRPVATRVRH